MARDKSREWLDKLLAGEVLAAEEAKKLLAECPKEGQHHDYKAGALLADKKADPASVLREYTSAFANSDGGFLLVGLTEQKQWDGAKAPGGATLNEWASRCLFPIPQVLPRISTATVDGKEILLVAVGRSRSLVAVVESGESAYHLRMGEQTLRIPPYLITDLMLGRRTHAQLRVKLGKPDVGTPERRPGDDFFHVPIQLPIEVENVGLSFAEDVRVGMVAWTATKHLSPSANQLLQREVSADTPAALMKIIGDFHLSYLPRVPDTAAFSLGAFDSKRLALPRCLWPLADKNQKPLGQSMDIKAGVYVFAKNEQPWWFQLTCQYSSPNPSESLTLSLDLLENERPVASLNTVP